MADYKIKSNKHSQTSPAIEGLWGPMHRIYMAVQKITGYQPPLEEKEHVLTELPKPDFNIDPKDPK